MSNRGENYELARTILSTQLGIASAELDKIEEVAGTNDVRVKQAQERFDEIYARRHRLMFAADDELQAVIDVVGPEVRAYMSSSHE